ncbi:MAG TPA: DUF4175 family protein [Lentimicrobium sp.]|nr:DUF4175 family protein [Lentimicrobium sp.]
MQDNYNILIDKLDAFIRKYYTNQLIKGILYSAALLGSFFLILALTESVAWFSTTVRTLLFYGFIALGLFLLVKYIIIPLLKLNKIGPRISHEMAAGVVGRHFNEVKDTLLNTLQLKRLSDSSPENYELIIASINARSKRLMNVPFKAAVDYSSNKRYLYFALPPLLLIGAFMVASPKMLTEPGTRLLKHSVSFEKPLPFKVNIKNKELTAIQQEDFILEIGVNGEELPSEILLEMDGNEFRMKQEDRLNFTYTFKKIQHDRDFRIIAAGYTSDEYLIKVLPKPIILNYDIEVDYPAYLNRKTEIISNVGDINVPQGTTLNWRFYTRDAENIQFRLGKEIRNLTSGKSNIFSTSHRLMEGTGITITSRNQYMTNDDSLLFYANAIPDLYPGINIEQYRDSIYDNKLYFRGIIQDDHGFRNMDFRLARINDDKAGAEMSMPVQIQKDVTEQTFYYYFDLLSLGLAPGENIKYYFEVWDNDGVNGSKSARSQEMTFKIPTLEEINAMVDKHSEELKDDFDATIKEAKSIQKEIEKLNQNLIDKKELNYQDKQQIEDLIERHKDLQNKVEKMELENKQMNSKESQIKQVDENIIEKQKQLEKLFEDIMSDEMKQMFEELQKMLDELNKDKIQDMLEKMKYESEDLEKDLDRNLELFKQLEFDKKLTESIDELKKLSEEEMKLSEETSNSNKKESDELNKQQDKLNEKFDDISKDLEELKQLNEDLEEPNDFEIPQDEKQDIKNEMNESTKNLKESQMKKASGHQQKASEKMKKMSEMLLQMQMEMENEAMGEDADALRAILENLVKISFSQEELMDILKNINRADPKYPSIVEKQKKIRDDLEMVEDSLLALSKRQTMIENFVNREIRDINNNTTMALEGMQNRATAMAASKQQYVMTAVNNLALLLSETLKNMEQALSMSASGKFQKGNPKPGQGKSSMKSMRQMQEKLNQQMEELREGKQPMPGKKGEQGQSGQSKMSEQLARMAAQQEALRKMLQKYSEELQKSGDVNQQGLQKTLQEMEKTETDLVNKRLNQETMKRQQEILTRLLESEKAEMKREQEERRESNEGKELPKPDPAKYFDSIGIPSKETELIKTIPPSLKDYYRNKVNSYFIQIPGESKPANNGN